MLKERGNKFALQNFHQYQKLATKKKPKKQRVGGKCGGKFSHQVAMDLSFIIACHYLSLSAICLKIISQK